MKNTGKQAGKEVVQLYLSSPWGIIGTFNPKGGVLSIIKNASSTVAGAAGETTGTRVYRMAQEMKSSGRAVK